MTIVTDGPTMAPEHVDVDKYHAGYGAMLGASAAESWADSPISQLQRSGEIERAKGEGAEPTSFDPLGQAVAPGFNGVNLTEDVKPAVPRMDMIEALDRVKKAGLEKHLTLPNQPDMPPAQLDIMIQHARKRRENEATIERGPQGFIPSALQVGTSFLVGAVDPINVASAFIPVMGELRYGKLLASAGDSVAGRLAIRAGVGGAQGAVGQAALEPLDWWSHTQEGRDFGMSDVLHNIMFGAALGGGLHAGGGFISDAYRGAKGRALYPFGEGEPLAPQSAVEPVIGVPPLSSSPLVVARKMPDGSTRIGEPGQIHADLVDADASHLSVSDDQMGFVASDGKFLTRDEATAFLDKNYPEISALVDGRRDGPNRQIEAGQLAKAIEKIETTPPSPAVDIINDLPPRAHEDAMRGAIANLIDGDAVRSGDMLEAAAQTDPRIAESFDLPPRPEPRAQEARVHGFDEKAGEILSDYRDDTAIKAHPDYVAAKAGDDAAADRFVGAMIKPESLEQAKRRFGADAIYAPVVAEEAKGHNAIPVHMAQFYAAHAGGSVDTAIIQANRAFHTGAGPMERLANRPLFDGDVIKGGKYVLVDDVSVMGSTLAAMADHIRRNGGEVAGVVTLANASRSGVLRAPKAHVADIERRYGHEVRDLFGIEPAALTADEAAYIRNFRDADALRSAVASAEGKRVARLRAKGIGDPEEGLSQPGLRPRSLGAAASDLDKAAAWRGLAHATPDFNTPDIIAKSNAAAKLPPVPTKLDERVAAAVKADAYAQQMYDMFAHRLPEEDRAKLAERLADMDRAAADQDFVSQRGAACLFEGSV